VACRSDPPPTRGDSLVQQRSRLTTAIVISIVAINSLGIGLVFPVMPALLGEVGQVDIGQAAAIGGLMSLAFAGMQVVFGPLLGALSDRFGRRPVLIISLLASALDYAILAVANALWMFFVIRMFAGIASATFSVSNAVLADTSNPEDRAAQFGLTGAAFGIGFVIGPLFGGVLGELGPRMPFVAAGLLCFVGAGLAALLLPETRSQNDRRALNWSDCIPFAAFGKLRHRLSLIPLFTAQFLDSIAGFVYPAVWAYFAVAQFGWSPGTVGLSLAGYGLCMALIQAGGVRILVQCIGEQRTAVLGLSLGVVGFALLSGLSSGWIAFVLMPLFAGRAISNSAISGLLSRQMPNDKQGELQGLLSGLTGLATMVSIPLMTQIFSAANSAERGTDWPGAPFAAAAAFSLLSLVILASSLRVSRHEDEDPKLIETHTEKGPT